MIYFHVDLFREESVADFGAHFSRNESQTDGICLPVMDDDSVSGDNVSEEFVQFFFRHRHMRAESRHDVGVDALVLGTSFVHLLDLFVDHLCDDTRIGITSGVIGRDNQDFLYVRELGEHPVDHIIQLRSGDAVFFFC